MLRIFRSILNWDVVCKNTRTRRGPTARGFRPTLECLEARLTPSAVTATVTGTTLTITKTTMGGSGSDLKITPFSQPVAANAFGAVTVESTGGDMINGSPDPFDTPKGITAIVVNLGVSGTAANNAEDTLTFDGSGAGGPFNLTGGLTINGTGGDKVLAFTNVNLLHSSALKINLTGNGAETSTFTNVNVGGAATISHVGVGNTIVTISDNAPLPTPATVYNWGSLAITNGKGADVNTINDTNFAGNVSIANGLGDGVSLGANGGSKTILGALNDETLATIGGLVTITTASGMSDTELFDYNVHGNVTINTGAGIAGQTAGSIADVESQQTFASSGIPALGGNVSINGTAVVGSSLAIKVGTSAVPLIIHGSLAIAATGTGVVANGAQLAAVTVNLTDLRIASAATTITLAGQTAADTVTIAAANTVSEFAALTIVSNATGDSTFNIQNMAGETDFGGSVSLQLTNAGSNSGDDTIQIGDPAGTVHITGNLGVTGVGTKLITVEGTRLSGTGLTQGNLNIALTGTPTVGNYVMNASFTDTAISGAATVTDPTYSGSAFTITTSGNAAPNTVFKWGSLAITNGEDGRVTINDTDFAGNVTINNGGNDDGDGINTTLISAVHDQNLATIGGSLSIINGSGPPSDTELFDYNVNGNVTIKNAPSPSTFVGLENVQTFPSSGVPVIGGNVTITTGSGKTNLGATAAVDIGTGGRDPYIYGGAASNNPLYIGHNLTITLSGGGVGVNLNDLIVPSGTTSVALGAASGNTLQVQAAASLVSVFDNFNVTSTATGGDTLSIQDQVGTTQFTGAVNVQFAGTNNTLNLAADTNNTLGVANAAVDLFSTSTFNGGTGTTSSIFEGIPLFNMFYAIAPKISHFH